MQISLQRRITLLPPLNEYLKLPECLFRCDVPLVRGTDLSEFLHDLLFIPWLDFTCNISFQMNGTELKIRFWESVSQRVFNAG